MKQFFKFMFASMLGTILTLIVVFFLFMGLIASIASFSEKEAVKVEQNSLLYMKLDKPIPDRTPKNPFSNMGFGGFDDLNVTGLNDMLKNIDKAAKDPNIKGIYLDLTAIPAGFANIYEVRAALEEFKESGKFILCYADMLAQNAYYLASVADEIYMNPEGGIFLTGLNAEVMFLEGTLEKLEIEAQVIRHGSFKGAVEPLMRKDLSEANELQMRTLLESIWSEISTTISEARNIEPENLNLIVDNLELTNASKALKHNFVDGLKYKDEILDMLKGKLGQEPDSEIKTVSMAKYTRAKVEDEREYTRDRVAVVYATGNITMGPGDESTIGAGKLAKAIREARQDENVKAIVLRVNSPGGDVLASEIIWREVELASGIKPLIVSMGNVAASGGYWISAPADKILADPLTITGSIGVFAVIPNMKEFFNDKLGITFDGVKTNENSDFPSVTEALSPYQHAVLKEEIERIYSTFLTKVSNGRNLSVEHVDSIGQGRVWSGIDAKRIGLIDEFGGLEKAITMAAGMAEIENYRLKELPVLKDPFEELFSEIFGGASASQIEKHFGKYGGYINYLRSISEMEGIQARMPYYFEIK